MSIAGYLLLFALAALLGFIRGVLQGIGALE
jgi:hypothetical protein